MTDRGHTSGGRKVGWRGMGRVYSQVDTKRVRALSPKLLGLSSTSRGGRRPARPSVKEGKWRSGKRGGAEEASEGYCAAHHRIRQSASHNRYSSSVAGRRRSVSLGAPVCQFAFDSNLREPSQREQGVRRGVHKGHLGGVGCDGDNREWASKSRSDDTDPVASRRCSSP
eukprot:9479977-Pyramimonas_sp.AAC.1